LLLGIEETTHMESQIPILVWGYGLRKALYALLLWIVGIAGIAGNFTALTAEAFASIASRPA
jgi:hypothetical protein